MKTVIAKFLPAMLALGCAAPANAALSFSQSIAGPAVVVAPIFTTPTPASAYTATDSLANVRLAPVGLSGSYLIVSSGGSATVGLGGVSSFGFVWGSPDLFNSIGVATSTGIETFTGVDFQALSGLVANGANPNTRWFSLMSAPGQTLESISFASGGVAFEVAVSSPVPEPETYALLLAGLMIVLYVGRRTLHRDRG